MKPIHRLAPTARRTLVLLGLAVLCLTLAACAGAPKKEKLRIAIQAAEDVNPDRQGRPSPITLHLLELKSSEQFNSLDYLSLTNATGSALGGDLMNRNQEVLAPGSNRNLELELDAGVTAIGLVAGYRDIDNANWRTVVPVTPGKTKSLTVNLGQFDLTATPN